MITDEMRIAAYKAVELRLDNQPDHEPLKISIYIDAALEAVVPIVRNAVLEEIMKKINHFSTSEDGERYVRAITDAICALATQKK